ncbi:MAG: peptide chain release factor N(5)-glutamine methyltransferase [Psychromonas sp.]
MRIDDALIWAEYSLVNSESALLDAQVLLAFVLEKETVYLLTWPERPLTKEQKSAFEELISKRINGVPVAHLTGIREFWSLSLKVNDSTLIPRPDTERLVEIALEHCSPNAKVLDLGTGTGAVILALASELPNAQCTGIDFSQAAVDLANENKQALNINNVNFKQSDWFSNVDGLFDIIVSNPPYIDENDHHLDQGDVRFEPLSALVAQQSGLSDIQVIAEQAKKHLSKPGVLLLEHGFEQGSAVRELLISQGYTEVETKQDYGNNDRVTFGFIK